MTLNVEFEFGPEEAPKRVVIYADGDIDFPDDDLTFDLAAQEFGYPETEVIKLYNRWKKDPIKFIHKDIGVPWVIKAWLLIESAEQVFPILEKTFSEKELRLLWQCLAQTRVTILDAESIDKESSKNRRKLLNLRKKADQFLSKSIRDSEESLNQTPPQSTMHAVAAIWAAAGFLDSIVMIGESCLAAATNASTKRNSPEWETAYREQELWEINRFVELTNIITSHVMGASTDPEK